MTIHIYIYIYTYIYISMYSGLRKSRACCRDGSLQTNLRSGAFRGNYDLTRPATARTAMMPELLGHKLCASGTPGWPASFIYLTTAPLNDTESPTEKTRQIFHAGYQMDLFRQPALGGGGVPHQPSMRNYEYKKLSSKLWSTCLVDPKDVDCS